jgi:hypothetical protein
MYDGVTSVDSDDRVHSFETAPADHGHAVAA